VHRVVNGQASVNVAAGAVDVHLDLALGVVLGQVQQLSHDQVGNDVVDWRPEEHDAILEEQGKDIVAALASAGLLDHHRHAIGNNPSHVRSSHLRLAHLALWSPTFRRTGSRRGGCNHKSGALEKITDSASSHSLGHEDWGCSFHTGFRLRACAH
jgi:hypothetical protein